MNYNDAIRVIKKALDELKDVPPHKQNIYVELMTTTGRLSHFKIEYFNPSGQQLKDYKENKKIIAELDAELEEEKK